jgi:hypothetical protein
MENRLVAVLTLVALTGSACARRIPESVGVAPGTPHMSWVLMYGDRDTPDREFSCQSEPRNECVLPASTPDERVFSDIHFYYHGVGGVTNYEGSKNLSYLQGSPESLISQVKVTATKNGSFTNESVSGIVTSIPGTYTVTVSVTATVTETGKTYPIQESFQVVVK